MKKKLFSLIGLSLVIISIYLVQENFDKTEENKNSFVVERVIDGDTIRLTNGKIVRLLGIDAPEKNQKYYLEAKEQLEKIEGMKVRLERDKKFKDEYGRLLRYVFVGKNFVNLELVSYGYARAMVVKPNIKYEKEFLEAERLAKKSQLGIWK